MHLEKLPLHDIVIPALDMAAKFAPRADVHTYEHWTDAGMTGRVFDARRIDPRFLDDTGDAALEELKATKGIVRLPFDTCCFEFGDHVTILASEIVACDDDQNEIGTEIEFYPVSALPEEDDEYPPPTRAQHIELLASDLPPCYPYITNWLRIPGEDEEPAFIGNYLGSVDSPYDTPRIVEELEATYTKRLIGILTLLNEHLVATEVVPDPCPQLNAKRAKKGRPPLSSETRVLTINTAAVRRAVRGTKLKQHESPRLHWRRGHWRVLHRGSEFESKTWVRRSLVGNPDRGFVHKDYRVVWEQPMLEAAR